MKNKKKSDPVKDDRERNDALNASRKKGDRKLPGEYDSREDIMNRRDTERVELDVDNFSRNIGVENFNKPGEGVVSNPEDITEEPVIGSANDPEQSPAREMERPVPRDLSGDAAESESTNTNESDVTREDLEALGPKDISLNMGEDESLLKHRVWPVDMAGDDLDVPGAELDDKSEEIGSEDEENNPYSIGGDRHEDQLEGK